MSERALKLTNEEIKRLLWWYQAAEDHASVGPYGAEPEQDEALRERLEHELQEKP